MKKLRPEWPISVIFLLITKIEMLEFAITPFLMPVKQIYMSADKRCFTKVKVH
ncbi:MAG: hypothetical protein ACOX4Q_11240 [Syntrophomonadales bacterium]|jgi:hypothetical protein